MKERCQPAADAVHLGIVGVKRTDRLVAVVDPVGLALLIAREADGRAGAEAAGVLHRAIALQGDAFQAIAVVTHLIKGTVLIRALHFGLQRQGLCGIAGVLNRLRQRSALERCADLDILNRRIEDRIAHRFLPIPLCVGGVDAFGVDEGGTRGSGKRRCRPIRDAAFGAAVQGEPIRNRRHVSVGRLGHVLHHLGRRTGLAPHFHLANRTAEGPVRIAC